MARRQMIYYACRRCGEFRFVDRGRDIPEFCFSCQYFQDRENMRKMRQEESERLSRAFVELLASIYRK